MINIDNITITAQDIQPTATRSATNPGNDNKVRKAWVLQSPIALENYLKKFPQETRFELYKDIDDSVSCKWVEIMRKHNTSNAEHQITTPDGTTRLSDEYCVNADEQLIFAAYIVVNELVELYIKK